MRNRFDRQLEQLNNELINMGSLIEEAIEMAITALMKQDAKKAKEIVDFDEEIDEKEREIESLCLKLLLQQQPVARDLRQISAALKMITDMERIGDHAADISEMTILMAGTPYIRNIEHLQTMAKEAMVMLVKSIEAYVEKEVAMEMIKQFPVYAEFAKAFINNYTDVCKEILAINNESFKTVVLSHQIVLEAFAKQIENTELTSEERESYSNKMIEEAEKITELYLQQQKFHERVLTNIGGIITIALITGATILGLKVISNDDLPEIEDEDDDVA